MVIDLQEKLVPAINNADKIVSKTKLLLESAQIIDIPILFTEQYPKGLGPTLQELSSIITKDKNIVSKLTFSSVKDKEACSFLDIWKNSGKDQIVLCGAETHVCVLQTAADLVQRGFEVYVITDACGSRKQSDQTAGYNRIKSFGASLVTTEMVIFEWLEVSGTDTFRKLSKLIK
tara:strand:+ start:66474 stop:66998 length:525 start_codon:yes stop_codon:yes gene_type:complete